MTEPNSRVVQWMLPDGQYKAEYFPPESTTEKFAGFTVVTWVCETRLHGARHLFVDETGFENEVADVIASGWFWRCERRI